MKTSINIRNVEKIQAYLKTVPRGTIRAAMEAIAEYIAGDESHGLKHYPGYKYVTRKSAYGMTFFTAKQRRWFWANGGPDMIGDNRTGRTADAWQVNPTNDGYRMSITNNTPGAYFTMHDFGQARQPARVGWRKVSEVVQSNLAGALRHANAMVKQFLQKGA